MRAEQEQKIADTNLNPLSVSAKQGGGAPAPSHLTRGLRWKRLKNIHRCGVRKLIPTAVCANSFAYYPSSFLLRHKRLDNSGSNRGIAAGFYPRGFNPEFERRDRIGDVPFGPKRRPLGLQPSGRASFRAYLLDVLIRIGEHPIKRSTPWPLEYRQTGDQRRRLRRALSSPQSPIPNITLTIPLSQSHLRPLNSPQCRCQLARISHQRCVLRVVLDARRLKAAEAL
jgi:hypothetical protein